MPDLFDTSELTALAGDFTRASLRVTTALRPTAERAGVNMKRGMKRVASGHRLLPHLADAVEYDVTQTPTSVAVEVGFRKEGQGNLANIAAYGTSKMAPFMDITVPLRDEVPAFMRYAARAASEAL